MKDLQAEKAKLFKSLHERAGLLVLPNPWDAGSAKLLAALGFEALATTSAGLAWILGKPDGAAAVTRAESMQNAREIVGATGLPVAADLENGYGDDPEECALTILQAAEAGLVGGSIEDATGKQADPIYPFELAVERVRAAVKAARSLPFPFMLAARAENLINGRPDLPDTIRRLEAFAEAGADVLYAPGLKTKEEVSAVVRAVAPRPVNVLVGTAVMQVPLDELAELGVKRVSLGSALARAAYGALMQTAEGLRREGDLSFVAHTVPYATLNDMLKKSYP
ncbi:MAG TPA: isocitrate lyase/phosphoenolpyruvate mutase family protein [Puia sp.]|jgi:2-methylisocitrate lyase-like PEP mutase family enzyme|nr:isocitrate lyase/phosphoenolpyruvate mutase family protein [Puia sp.]